MFTGLIQEIGRLRAVSSSGGIVRVQIEAPETARRLGVGDSVAVNGICLTVTRCGGRTLTVEAVGETRRLTTLGQWRAGRRLHLEPALRVGDPLDGHLVQGHVDGLGEVRQRRQTGGGLVLTIATAAAQRRFLTPKGSVAIDGVSLTVDEGPFAAGFSVNLIPHTLASTNLADLRIGDRVNLEMDILVKAARSGTVADLPALDSGSNRTESSHRGWTAAQLLAKGFGKSRHWKSTKDSS